MSMGTLGVDLGIRATHVATLCDSRGEVVWSKKRFSNRHEELVALVDQIGDCDELTVVMEHHRHRRQGHRPLLYSSVTVPAVEHQTLRDDGSGTRLPAATYRLLLAR